MSAAQQADPQVLVIVDGYSSGAQLPGVMAEHGWRCVHVRASANPPDYFAATHRPENYVADLTFDGDVEATAAALRRFSPSALLPGAESGVVVADRLAAALGLPGNDPTTSPARRDKYVMHERLKARGLRHMDHIATDDLDTLRAWAQAGDWPVVVKPRASAGTDSVTFCADVPELEDAFHRLHGATDQLGGRNDTVLAQRLLVGQEYFINGVSGNGCHVITEIWRADKTPVEGAGLIYDRSVLCDPLSAEMAEVVAYVKEVLDALGARHGATHTELMVTTDGPVLIECASRLSGGLNRPAATYAVGASMLDLTASVVVEGGEFVERLHDQQKELQYPLWQVQFISDRAGVVTESYYDDLTAALRSRTWLQRAPRPGENIMRTTDLFSSPGIVFMSHPDPDVLQADYETVRRWERENRLFVVR